MEDGAGVAVSAPWRIVTEGRIEFASRDDGQWFGLASPLDGEAKAHNLLCEKSITSAKVDRQTADLSLYFDPATRIDVFNHSSGYEAWLATYVIDGKHWSVVAKGGGDLAFFDRGA